MSRFGYVQEVIFFFFRELIHLSASRAKSLLKMEIPIRIWFYTSQSHPVIILQSKEMTWANLHIYTYTLCSMHILPQLCNAIGQQDQREALLSKNTSCGRLGRPKQEMEFPKQKWYHGLLKCQ